MESKLSKACDNSFGDILPERFVSTLLNTDLSSCSNFCFEDSVLSVCDSFLDATGCFGGEAAAGGFLCILEGVEYDPGAGVY